MIFTTRKKMAIAKSLYAAVMLFRRMIGLGRLAEVKRGGINWRLDLEEGIDFSIYLFGMFDHATIKAYRQILHQGSVVLDIGANIGAHTLHMAKFVGTEGKVLSFEPTKFAFDKLQANIRSNPSVAKRIEAYQVMLVDKNDALPDKELYSSWPLRADKNCHEKHCGKMRSTQGGGAVTLDRFCEVNKIENIHLMKIDVDGAECSVIRGALGVISRDKPVLIMELCPYVLEERGSSVEELLDLLSSEGYELKEIISRKPISSDARLLRSQVPDGASINVEAWPKNK